MFGCEPMRGGGAAFQKGQGLDHFGGGAGQHDGAGFAPCLNDLAGVVADDRVALMRAFQKGTAPDFG